MMVIQPCVVLVEESNYPNLLISYTFICTPEELLED